MTELTDWKTIGNNHFINKEFDLAEAAYSKALDDFGDGNKVILLTNRAASRNELGLFEGSIKDCDQAIELDPNWTKAYYRKATALDKLGFKRECYLVWKNAKVNCEETPWLLKQFKTAEATWLTLIRSEPLQSEDDFIERFNLLKDSRERLSTLAHFWNESNFDERLHHFQFLLSIIGGEGELSELNKSVTADMMTAMPLHNYEDLPKSAIEKWCAHFTSLESEGKTALLERIWNNLTSGEKEAVLADLKLFIAQAWEMKHNPPVVEELH